MRRIPIALALVLALALPSAVMYAGLKGGKTTKPRAKTVSAVCPVMGNKIPDVRRAAGKSTYNGKTYYFCCRSCKPAFDKDPEKYVGKQTQPAQTESAVCPVMGGKIRDVSKAAAKSEYRGKTYYFCCPGCKPAFDKDPEKYVGGK